MVSRRQFLACLPAALVGATPRPNLVVFLSDDHGFLDSSVYGSKDALNVVSEQYWG
jgi:hypothetical protein